MADADLIRSSFSEGDLTEAQAFVYSLALSMSSNYEHVLWYLALIPGTGYGWLKNGKLGCKFGHPTIEEGKSKFFKDHSFKRDYLIKQRHDDEALRKKMGYEEIPDYWVKNNLRDDARLVLEERDRQFRFDNLLLMVLAGSDTDAIFDQDKVLRLQGDEWMFHAPENAEASFKSLTIEVLRRAETSLMAKSNLVTGPPREKAEGERADRVRALIHGGLEKASPGYHERRNEGIKHILKALKNPLSEIDA